MVLFNVRLLSELPLAVATAERLVAKGEPVAFCAESAAAEPLSAITRAAEALHARCFNMESMTAERAQRANASAVNAWKRRASRLAARVIERATPLEEQLSDEFAAQSAAAHDILRDSAADVFIVAQDGAAGNAPLIAAAVDAGIPVVDCPYGSGTSRDFDDYLDERHAEGTLKLAKGPLADRIRRECPQWIRPSKYGDVLMYVPEYILARERAGLSLPLPWVIHGGMADLLAAESETMRRRYLDEGIASAKVELTGTVYCDVMHAQLSRHPECEAAFKRGGKVRAGVTSVLVSLPPSLHGVRAQNSEFTTYEDACRAIAAIFAGTDDLDAIVSLHPNASPEQRAFIESLGLPVSDEWILRLIPRYDVFFTTFSSTIRWAIACGKPVLNYNMYGYDNHDYDAVAGVFTRQRLAEIGALLSSLQSDREYERVASRQKDEGEAWGMMDGRNFDRIHGAIDRLRQARGVRSSR